MNINGVYKEKNTYDAIVIGSGISGGWAAKELTEKGLKTLVLERGRMVEHIKDYTTAHKAIWEFPHRNKIPRNVREENPIVSRCYAFREATENYFVKDDNSNIIRPTILIGTYFDMGSNKHENKKCRWMP